MNAPDQRRMEILSVESERGENNRPTRVGLFVDLMRLTASALCRIGATNDRLLIADADKFCLNKQFSD